MAQTAAAHSGLRGRKQSEPIRIGYLLGTRRLDLMVEYFLPGQTLVTQAQEVWSDGELGSFACQILDEASGAVLAACTLSAFSPHTPAHEPGLRDADSSDARPKGR